MTTAKDQGHERSQLRITPWPGRLPHPLYRQWHHYSITEGGRLAADVGAFITEVDAEKAGHDVDDLAREGLLPDARQRAAAQGRPPKDVAEAGEIYLELIETDLDDESAILNFVNRFGILNVRYRAFALVDALPGLREDVLPSLQAAGGRQLDTPGPGLSYEETLAEFRFGALLIRDLVYAWQILSGAEPVPPTYRWQSVPDGHVVVTSEVYEFLEENGFDPSPRHEAHSFLLSILNPGLAPFHPRLDSTGLTEHAPGAIFQLVPLYAICCLELYNHISDGIPYRNCANETCRRLFVRQVGRAEHGQHRSEGVKYCSKHCARAMAQRRYRERKRATSAPSD